MVATLLLPFSYLILFVDRMNVGSWMGSNSSVFDSLDAFLFFLSVVGKRNLVSSSVRGMLYNAMSMRELIDV